MRDAHTFEGRDAGPEPIISKNITKHTTLPHHDSLAASKTSRNRFDFIEKSVDDGGDLMLVRLLVILGFAAPTLWAPGAVACDDVLRAPVAQACCLTPTDGSSPSVCTVDALSPSGGSGCGSVCKSAPTTPPAPIAPAPQSDAASNTPPALPSRTIDFTIAPAIGASLAVGYAEEDRPRRSHNLVQALLGVWRT